MFFNIFSYFETLIFLGFLPGLEGPGPLLLKFNRLGSTLFIGLMPSRVRGLPVVELDPSSYLPGRPDVDGIGKSLTGVTDCVRRGLGVRAVEFGVSITTELLLLLLPADRI
tara:strand:+ start:403 stop:735 length:333 start_codon:yes stop_codon:yes gene_type:complete